MSSPLPMPKPPAVLPRTGDAEKRARMPIWHVVLLDDQDHTYVYVVEMLMQVLRIDGDEAFVHALTVDTQGATTIATCHRERAEVIQQAIHQFGPDPLIPSCKGSMRCRIEPAV